MIVALVIVVTAAILVVPAVVCAALVIELCIDGPSYDRAVTDVDAYQREREAPQRLLADAAHRPFDPTRYSAAIDRALPQKARARRLLWPRAAA